MDIKKMFEIPFYEVENDIHSNHYTKFKGYVAIIYHNNTIWFDEYYFSNGTLTRCDINGINILLDKKMNSSKIKSKIDEKISIIKKDFATKGKYLDDKIYNNISLCLNFKKYFNV